MGFMASLLTALEADLVANLGITAGSAYRGREPREATATHNLEAWLEPLDVPSDQSGIGGILTHQVRLHFRSRGPREGSKSGAAQSDAVRLKLEAAEARYAGRRPIYGATGMGDLVVMHAVIDRADADATEREIMDASLLLTALERV